MKAKAPAYQKYPDKWLADTRLLSWKAKGLYGDLLDVIWMQYQDTCSIPNNDAHIARELGATLEDWMDAKAELLNEYRPLLVVLPESNSLFSKGLYKEAEKQRERRYKLSLNGAKGGRPKKQKVFSEKAEKSLPTPTPTPIPNNTTTQGEAKTPSAFSELPDGAGIAEVVKFLKAGHVEFGRANEMALAATLRKYYGTLSRAQIVRAVNDLIRHYAGDAELGRPAPARLESYLKQAANHKKGTTANERDFEFRA